MKPSADYIAGVDAMRDLVFETLREMRADPDITEERHLLLAGLGGAVTAHATNLRTPLRRPTDPPSDAEA